MRSLREIIEEARELHLESVEVEGIKYTLGANIERKLTLVPEEKAEALMKPLSPLDEYTDEEIQFYATPYFDELQARKEAQAKQKKEDDELKKESRL